MTRRGRPLTGSLALADYWLREWGRELDGYDGGSGHTILSRLIQYGPNGAAQTGKPVTALADPRIAQVDEIVRRLTPRYRRVLRAWYVGIGGSAYNRVVAAQAARMREHDFNEHLKHARQQVADHMGLEGAEAVAEAG